VSDLRQRASEALAKMDREEGGAPPAPGKTYLADPRLSFDNLRTANVTRLKHFPGHFEEEAEPWSTQDWFVAVTGELGELGNMLKKIRRGTSYPGMVMPSGDDLAEEIADVATYLDLLAAHLGIDLGEAIIRKFNKVSERWDLPDRL
jgi:NTP pyrophosphatase (non-canonical NTP hydrolase)